MADIYGNIPDVDSRGRPGQRAKFVQWNSDPVGNDASNLASISPDLQRVIARARADNPNLNFVIGNGLRTAAQQDQAKAWGWSRVGSKDGGDALVHMNGNAVDLWGLDANGRVQFQPAQQKQIAEAIKTAAQNEGVNLNWGGDWKTFKDAPHFELAGGGSAQNAGGPEGHNAVSQPPSAASALPTPGTTLNSSSVIDALSKNIAGIESGTFKDPYTALNPTTHAVGKYQVMPSNIPGWTLAATGKSMTPEEFKASPAAQEAVFRDQMQRNLQLYSPADAASIWFTGKPYNVAGGAVKDAVGTTNANYVARATAGIPNAGATFTPGPAVAAASGQPSGAPNLTAGGSSAPAAPGQPAAPQGGLAASLPGFTPNSPGAKMTAQGLQSLAGGQTGQDAPQPMHLPSPPPAMAVGGQMMMGPGGMNMLGRTAAQQAPVNQYGFRPAQSGLPSTVGSSIQSAPAGGASGLGLGLPGTTLNSPSQLQMAMMYGSLDPSDPYGRMGGGMYGGMT